MYEISIWKNKYIMLIISFSHATWEITVMSCQLAYGVTSPFSIMLIIWQNVSLLSADYIYGVNEPHTEHLPFLNISCILPISPSSYATSPSCFMSGERYPTMLCLIQSLPLKDHSRQLLLHKHQLFIKSVGGQLTNYQKALLQRCAVSMACWLLPTVNWLHSQLPLSDEDPVSYKRFFEMPH